MSEKHQMVVANFPSSGHAQSVQSGNATWHISYPLGCTGGWKRRCRCSVSTLCWRSQSTTRFVGSRWPSNKRFANRKTFCNSAWFSIPTQCVCRTAWRFGQKCSEQCIVFSDWLVAPKQINSQADTPSLQYRDAFLKACEDYNGYGAAVSNKKIQVDASLALKLYGLKVLGLVQFPKIMGFIIFHGVQ